MLLALVAFCPSQTMAKDPGGGHGGGKGENRTENAHQSGAQHGGVQHGGVQQKSIQQSNVQQNSIQQNSVQQNDVRNAVRNNLGGQSNTGISGPQGIAPRQTTDAHRRPIFSGNGEEGRDAWRYRWDNNHWWFWGPGNQWMLYGDNGQWQEYGDAYDAESPMVEEFSGGPIKIVNPAKNNVTVSYTLDGTAFTIPPGYSQDLQEDRAWVIEFNRGTDLEPVQYGLQSGVYTFAVTDQGLELYRSEFPKTVAPTVVPQPPKAAPTDPSQE